MAKVKTPISAVIFDLWDTLIYDIPEIETARGNDRVMKIHDILYKEGIDVNLQTVAFAYDCVGGVIEKLGKSNKALTVREQVKLIAETIRIQPDNRLLKLMEDAYNRANNIILSPYVPQAIDIVEILFRKYRLALISNTERSSGCHLMQAYHDLLKRFTVTYFSDERRLRKPHKETFLVTASELGVDPSACVFVGDNEETDCIGATNVGMKAIHFADPARGIRSSYSPQVTSLVQISHVIEKI